MPAPISERRKKFMDHLCKVMDLLDPSGQNSQNYRNQLDGLSDSAFDRWARDFLEDESANFYLEIVEYERDLTLENIEKCAEYMHVPLVEKVALPYLTKDPDHVIVTPEPVPVGYIHEKRMPQTLMKKSHASLSASKRNPKTGQVTGEDKNARNSDTETYSMIASGAEMALREFMGPRADDTAAKAAMYSAINRKGYVSMEELPNDPKNKVAINTMDVLMAYQGLLTNLVSPLDQIGPGAE